MRAASTALAVTAAIALAGCSLIPGSSGSSGSGEPELKASGAYVPQPVLTDMAGGFLVVSNTGGADDRLTGVTSDIADTVEMHETVDNQMRQVKSFKIPAGGKLELERGGNHLMFLKLKHKPEEGEKVSVELHFATSDPIELDVPVEATNYNPQK